ncbi:sulfate ABC transporter substrate-binding protein, partial [Limnospira fusiformis KN01]
TREVAEAFVQFLYTPQAQRAFAQAGFRPVDPTIEAEFSDRFLPINNLFTVEDLGGWDAVQNQFFADGAMFDEIQAQVGR